MHCFVLAKGLSLFLHVRGELCAAALSVFFLSLPFSQSPYTFSITLNMFPVALFISIACLATIMHKEKKVT